MMSQIKRFEMDTRSNSLTIEIYSEGALPKIVLNTRTRSRNTPIQIILDNHFRRVKPKDHLYSLTLGINTLRVGNSNGVYFLDLESQEDGSLLDRKITLNLTRYYKCLVDRVLRIKGIENCKPIEESCEQGGCDAILISTILNSIESAASLSLVYEVNYLVKAMDEICELCVPCAEYDCEDC